MPANLENSAVATGLEKVSFHSNLKEKQCQRMFKLLHNCTQLSCQQINAENSPSQASVACELRTPRCSSWIQKRQGNQRSNCQHLMDHRKSKRIPGKQILCFINQAKAFDCVDHSKLWKILQEMGIPDYLTCLLRNLYADQEATVRTRDGTTNWFRIGKGGHQGCIVSPCLFNLYAEYIMQNAGLNEAQAGIKISRRNINNLRYSDGATLIAEHKDELKCL